MRWRVLILLFLTATMGMAQAPKAQPHAITGVRVILPDDKTLPKATVVIRDGLISEVGPEARIPADAIVIDGTGLTVYPGLIDAGAVRGYDVTMRRSAGGPPAPEDLASDILAATKPDNRRGMTPEFEIHTALKADEEARAKAAEEARIAAEKLAAQKAAYAKLISHPLLRLGAK